MLSSEEIERMNNSDLIEKYARMIRKIEMASTQQDLDKYEKNECSLKKELLKRMEVIRFGSYEKGVRQWP